MYLSIYIYNPFLDHWWGRRRGSPQRSPCSAKAGPSGKKLRRRSGKFTEKNRGATSPNFNKASIEDHLLELGFQVEIFEYPNNFAVKCGFNQQD